MTKQDNTCKICGAACARDPATEVQACVFCGFEHHSPGGNKNPGHPVADIKSLPAKKIFREVAKRTSRRIFHAEGISPDHYDQLTSPLKGAELKPFDQCEQTVDVLISENFLPFVADVNDYFSERFERINKGGLLYLSTPVRRPLRKSAPLTGQINFFRSKNIMFLLEQRGFKMAWRENRFSTTLRIIARRC